MTSTPATTHTYKYMPPGVHQDEDETARDILNAGADYAATEAFPVDEMVTLLVQIYKAGAPVGLVDWIVRSSEPMVPGSLGALIQAEYARDSIDERVLQILRRFVEGPRPESMVRILIVELMKKHLQLMA